MGAHELESLLKRIKEALDALILVEQGEDGPPEAKQMLPMLEMKAHEEMVSAISDLAALFHAPPVQALADEYREFISSIWQPGDDSEDKGIGWGFFNAKTAAAQRPLLITKVKNLLHGFQPGQDIFRRPLTAQVLFIDSLFSFFEPCGFYRSDLPLITEQYGDPPLFRKLRSNSNCNPYESHPEAIDIEEVLGRYVAANEQITLFADGIRWAADELKVNEAELRFVVLVHEIAHWVVHRLPANDAKEYPLELYDKSETLFHETLAQLLTHWVSTRVSASFRDVFEKLNVRQTHTYNAFRGYVLTPPAAIIESIIEARNRDVPSTFSHLAADIAKREAQQGAALDGDSATLHPRQ